MNEPFGLPRGTVRASITILLIAVSAVMLFVPAVDDGVRQMFLLLTGIAVRDYFSLRSTQNAEDGPALDKPETF